MSSSLPRVTWSQLLLTAPYFDSVLFDAIERERAHETPPLVRAAYYFGLFNGEISNGGVMQYFFNHAFHVPSFEHAPDFIAQNPVLAAAIPFVTEVHAAWNDVALDVIKARARDDWPEELFSSHGERFDALETAFFAVNHDIAQRLCQDIIRNPHSYLDVEPIAEVPAEGVAHISLFGGTQRLRFEDGFPIGPNMFEQRDGDCNVVWFSRDRQMLTCETGYAGMRARSWIHYPSLVSGDWREDEDGDSHIEAKRALWTRHGLSETFRRDGSLEHAEFHRHGRAVFRELFFYSDGTPNLRTEDRPEGEFSTRFWPNGAINNESLESEPGRPRYLRCLDADGADLAPGGTGRFLDILPPEEGRRVWREGRLVGGYLEGPLLWMESDPDGSNPRETDRADCQDGRQV